MKFLNLFCVILLISLLCVNLFNNKPIKQTVEETQDTTKSKRLRKFSHTELLEHSIYDLSIDDLVNELKFSDFEFRIKFASKFREEYSENPENAIEFIKDITNQFMDTGSYSTALEVLSYLDQAKEVPTIERNIYNEWIHKDPKKVLDQLAQWNESECLHPTHQISLVASIYQHERKQNIEELFQWLSEQNDEVLKANFSQKLCRHLTLDSTQKVGEFIVDNFTSPLVRISSLDYIHNYPEEQIEDSLDWIASLPPNPLAGDLIGASLYNISTNNPEKAVEILNQENFLSQFVEKGYPDSREELFDRALSSYIDTLVNTDIDNALLAVEHLNDAKLKSQYKNEIGFVEERFRRQNLHQKHRNSLN